MIIQGRLLRDPEHAPPPGWVAVEDGRITAVETGTPPTPPDAGGPECLVCPGFVDAHVHLPQIDSIGCDGLDLLAWLDAVIYPAETGWADATRARQQVEEAYRRLLRAGTLAYAGYLTSHAHDLEAVRAAHARWPLRAVVGRSLMDRNGPDELIGQAAPTAPPAPPDDRLTFSVNPRFAIACSPRLLEDAGRHAAAGAPVQTHLAEQVPEVRRVRQLFPEAAHYTGVYDDAGLLRPGALLAHGVHLGDAEWALIAERGAVVVHCPTANTFLRSGLFDLDAARRHGVRVALGSDVAAGPDLAMPRVARAMIEVAKLRAMTTAPGAHVPTPAEAWRLITAGNAEAIGLADAGRLEPGARADLLVLAPPIPADGHLVGRLLYTWRDEYVVARVLNGVVVSAEATERRSGGATKGA